MTKYNEITLPTKEEIENLRLLNFGDFTSQSSYGDELNREFAFIKDRFLICLKCKAHEDLIAEAASIEEIYKEKLWEHLDEVNKKGTAIYDELIDKPYNKIVKVFKKLTINNPKQKIIDLAFQPVFDIKNGSICVEIVITEKEEDRTVIGLVFFHNNKYCFICTSCWNALITQPNVKNAFNGEKLHFVKESIPNENLIFKTLPLVLGEIEK